VVGRWLGRLALVGRHAAVVDQRHVGRHLAMGALVLDATVVELRGPGEQLGWLAVVGRLRRLAVLG
jgi:hypothetical protein